MILLVITLIHNTSASTIKGHICCINNGLSLIQQISCIINNGIINNACACCQQYYEPSFI